MHTTDKADGVIKSQLVCVKSRITAVISITKLELCATLLSSRLMYVIIPVIGS